ncbi:hypothetical protein [Natrinema versiforme]|uniref:DUF8107 domain-containing protein n=1 Tax=Natrinema versiforme JCM 10478 TaxID=1227496 RepID=L9Y0B0_9EURY|nr:hypothetical protein [Natrinema versiforme]ELY67504.1 hypothetical protein C489_10449 [Natrinema versiforme JCM 10478]
MAEPDGEPDDGLQEGLESSQGNPRVLLLLNAVLSTLFALLFVWGASRIDILVFTPTSVATVALVVFLLTHVVSRP